MTEKVIRPYPNVWCTFEAPDDHGDLVQYRIQDLPEDRFEDGIEHMRANFLLDEPLCRARDMVNDERSVIDYTAIWREVIFDEKLSLVCFQDGSDDIVGMNVLYIYKKEDLADFSKVQYTKFILENQCSNTFQFKSEHMQDIIRSAEYMFHLFDVFEHYKVDRYLSAVGLSVMPRYRGRGIALKLLEAR